MRLSAPTQPVFIISVVLGVIGILPMLGIVLPVIGAWAGWALVAGFILLVLANLLKGL